MSNTISRQEKLNNISGEKYPREFNNRITIKSLLDIKPILGHFPPQQYNIAGRISARRNMGKNIFFDIFDQTGSIQLHIKKPEPKHGPECAHCLITPLDETVWNQAQEADIGDLIGVSGHLGQNPRGEPLLRISGWTLLAKALREPPANYHGVKNPELAYRHREQDLMSSADSREVFKKRAKIIFEIRKYLNKRDFIEIETPILQPVYGGATAKPFKTKHNALSQDFFLSISSELYLKRALVGGYDRVYSISRCFRNEGISPEHNPEFTNLEIFESCKTADDMEVFTAALIGHLESKFGNLDNELEFRKSMPAEDWPLSRHYLNDKVDYPIADAWELYVNDMEIASGATDINDPREQESRLKGVYLSSDDKNFNPYDQNYIEALEMGALPWAGVGIGIDRLCMLLLNKKNIREVLMFPLLKDKK